MTGGTGRSAGAGAGRGGPVRLRPHRAATIGVGVRADPDSAAVRLLDAGGNSLGEGVAQLRRLEAGRYIIEARAPADGPALVVRPAVIGLTPPGRRAARRRRAALSRTRRPQAGQRAMKAMMGRMMKRLALLCGLLFAALTPGLAPALADEAPQLDILQRADGARIVPEHFLRSWDPVTVFFRSDVGPQTGGPEDAPEALR